MITIVLQAMLFGVPALLYAWMAVRGHATGLMLLSIGLGTMAILTGGEGIDRLAPLVFLPLAALGFLRALRGGDPPRFGPFFTSARSTLLAALGGVTTAVLVLICTGTNPGQSASRLLVATASRPPLLLLAASALGPAIGEEFFFRGVILSELKQKLGRTLPAVAIVAAYFALVHLNRVASVGARSLPLGILYVVSLFVAGMACGYARLGWGLAAAVAWHGAYNLVVLGLN